MRVAVGLAPVWLAALILLFEAVREPSLFLQLFGTAGAAEEVAARSGAGDRHEATRETDVAENASAFQTAGAPASAPALPKATTYLTVKADVALEVESEKSAVDRAKKAGAPAATDADGPSGGAPAKAETVTAVPADASLHVGDDPSVESVLHADDVSQPDPRSPVDSVAEAPIDPAAAEAAEEALALSRSDRREVQRRLRFAGSDPTLIDGIFGPATRASIAAWQDSAGLPATGYMDEPSMALLVEQTADEHRAWRAAERARARQKEEEEEAQSEVVVSSTQPWPSPPPADGCRRLPSGEIAFGRDVSCNFRAFGENFRRDLRDLKGSLRDLVR